MEKATRINLLDFKTIPMRTFHVTWSAFFLSFFSWFAIAPLMPLVREDLGLTKDQVANTIIASVAAAIFVRLIIGWLCDRIGPRRSYTALLILCALPITGIGLSTNYETFLLFRLAIGAIGASFVITQYHTSIMFAPNCIGAANATTAGWGNLGGGITQMVMPLILSVFLGLGFTKAISWRLSMIVPGVLILVMAIIYYRLTKDQPDGNMSMTALKKQQTNAKGSFRAALKDKRVWALAGIYAGSFGVELTINNIAALYFTDQFHASITTAGLLAGLFGLMNIFARSLGGIVSDRYAIRGGLKARANVAGLFLFVGGVILMLFSKMNILPLAVITMMSFGLFVKMTNGATYAIIPFINKKALGAVAGIVGAAGNLGAMAYGFLFKIDGLSYQTALFYLGLIICGLSCCALLLRFKAQEEEEHKIVPQAISKIHTQLVT